MRVGEEGLVADWHLHVEGEAHLVVEAAQVDLDHAVDEGALVDVVVCALGEQAEKSVVDDARELRVLEERDLVNELLLVV